ncbi:MAG: CoA-disulfide reductase [Calditrichaceae bacterium]|nr:CoA-disulfide reductase [Calditrichaceae bacterium]
MNSSQKHIIIIGGNAAGMSAASKIRRNDPKVKITVFEKSNYVSYAACGLPYFISGDIDRADNLIAVKMDDFIEKRNIQVKLRHEGQSFDSRSKTVNVKNLDDDRIIKLEYDKLIIATGASPIMPSLAGSHLQNIFVLRTMDQGIILKEHIERANPKNALIIGGGYIGLEMAEALVKKNLKATLVEMRNQLMNTVDKEISDQIENYLKEKGCEVLKSDKVTAFIGDNKVEAVRFQRSDELPIDLVIASSGVQPNVEFAVSGGVELGKSGAIAVNTKMQTNKIHVYAAGDCAEAKNLLTGKSDYVPLGTTANKQGRVAGDNASGKVSHFNGMVATATVKVFDLEIARTGLTEQQATDLHIPYKKVVIKDKTKASYYPGSKPMTVLLIFNAINSRLLGAQIAGYQGAAKRIDILATALHKAMTVQEIAELDLSYAPPFAPVWDPVLIAANQAVKNSRQ